MSKSGNRTRQGRRDPKKRVSAVVLMGDGDLMAHSVIVRGVRRDRLASAAALTASLLGESLYAVSELDEHLGRAAAPINPRR